MEFKELILKQTNEVGDAEQRFLEKHSQVIKAGRMMAEYAVELANRLKEMRDQKLYLAANFETFGDYCEVACGIKERQSYNYIKVLERFDENFLQSNSNLGVTKLNLLSMLTDEEIETVSEKVNIDEIGTRDLKVEIEKIRSEKEEAELTAQKNLDTVLTITEEKHNLEATFEKKTLELQNKIKQLKDDLKTEKEKPAEVITVENESTMEKVKTLEEELAKKERELTNINKQLAISSDTSYLEFKVIFANFQECSNKLITALSNLDSEKQIKMKSAIKSLVERWSLC